MVRIADVDSGKPNAADAVGQTFRERMSKSSNHRRTMTQPAPATEKKSRSSRHRRSISSFLPTMPEKRVSTSSHGRRDLVHSQGKGHRRSRSMPQSGSAKKAHTRSMSSLDNLGRPEKSLNGQTFYVRVSLGSLTGIKVSRSSRKKKTNEKFLVKGYASLASSGSQIAISQPFASDLEASYSNSSKLIWASSGDETNRVGRLLHFSLQLQQESWTEENARDDNSVRSQCSYQPKVIKIMIGLQCGDERFPLGIANLVVNGKTGNSSMLDLAMRQMDDSSEKKSRQSKQRLGIFGSTKKQGISFSDDCWYTLSSNATLRVKVDSATGEVGMTKQEVWGDDDDASAAEFRSNREKRTDVELEETASVVHDKREHDHTPEEFMFPSLPSPRKSRSRNMSIASVPLEYVTVTTAGRSFTSDISSRRSVFYGTPCEVTSAMAKSCFGGLCGNSDSLAEEPEVVELNKLGYKTNGRSNTVFNTAKLQPETDFADVSSPGMVGDSYEDLKDAQATLRRYAKRAGIDIEDILDKVEASAQASFSKD